MIVEDTMEYSLEERTDAESETSLDSTKLEIMFEDFVRDFKMQKSSKSSKILTIKSPPSQILSNTNSQESHEVEMPIITLS